MFFVILSHCQATSEWMAFLQPFFLTGFFFISGYFFINFEKKIGAIQKLLNILTSILLPYILYWVLSSCVNMVIVGNFSILNLYMDILNGNKLWFASALFVAECISYLCVYIPSLYIKKKYPISLLLVGECIFSLFFFIYLPNDEYIWSWRAALFANFYFCIGILIRLWNSLYEKVLNSSKIWIISSLLYVTLFFLDVYFVKNVGCFHKEFSNYPFFIVESLISVYVFIGLFYRLAMKSIKIPVLSFIGMNSLLFYFFQHQIILLIQKTFIKFDILLNENICPLVYAILVVLILYPIIYIVSRYMPIIAGKYRIKYGAKKL